MNPLSELLGESPGIGAVRQKLGQLLQRQTDARRLPPILLQGETGTGKGLLARVIHRAGPRRDGPFVDVNCAAIPETLLEAEMFGFERGAFTDARQAKMGLFQAAHRGTIFLDEVGLLPEPLQAKLLKVIEEQAVRRLGSTRTEPVDVWILAATSEDLAVVARERRFREDLYHRLAVVPVWLPPLRERGQDILLLAEVSLARACADYQLPPKEFDAAARAALLAYRWPGNIRELNNVIERVALLSEGPVVTAQTLGLPEASLADPGQPARGERAISLADAVGSAERAHLLEALRETDWNISRAASLLGISRNTLRYRIEKHGLRPGISPAAPRHRHVERAPALEPPTPAATPAEVAVPPALRWERRRLTLLRADLVPPRQERFSVDSSRQLEALVDKVQTFGGRIEELSPTGLVAAFGLEPVEDAPKRAVLAAMAIQKAMEHPRRGGAEPPAIKIGIHVGHFLVWRADGASKIDLEAKRQAETVLEALLAGAQSDHIVVSEAAAPFLERRFELVPESAGASGGERAYRLARREEAGLGLGGRLTTFVGRRHELELLHGRLASALTGQGQVVGIVGEAGIGKSRLLFEFRQSLAAEQVSYFEGRCLSYGSAIPYLPVLDILRQSCGITDTDTLESIVHKVRRSLEEVEMDPDEGTPYLIQLLGIKEGTERLAGLSPEMTKARALDTLRQMSLRGSRRRPAIFVVEDLHWIDKASEDCLASLLDSLPGAPILFLASYRPGYRPPWMDKSYATQMALQPLTPEESLSVVTSVLGAARPTDALVEALLSKAEGNPFFLEELAWAVRDQPGVSKTLPVPETLEELLLARIDRLPDEPKRLLQTASVLGRAVPLRLLEAIWQGPGALEPHLRELKRLEFLYEQTAAEEPIYVFKHMLTQEVAYASLLEDRRRACHRAAGRALEELYAGRTDEVVELLARHFGQSDEDEKAVDYAILAAEKAQRRWANAEALTHFEAALRPLEGMPDTEPNQRRRIDAVVKQAEIKFALGRHAEHVQALEHIRDLVEKAADPRRRAAWYYWTGFLHSLTGGRPEVAIAYCREASAIADSSGLDEIRALAESCLLQVYTVAGDLRGAVNAGERALAVFEARGNIWWACRTLWNLSAAANALGEWERSLAYCRRALDHGQTVNDLRLRVVGWYRTGSARVQQGDLEPGLRCYDEALTLSPIPFDVAMIKAGRGYGLVKAGEVQAGTAELEEAVAWFDRSNLRYSRSSWALRLAEGCLKQGERARARGVLEEVLRATRQVGYRHLEGIAERLLGECLAPEDPSAAEGHLEEAVRILEGVDARNELARALVAQADLRLAKGDPSGARQLLTRALAIFEALGTLDEPPLVRAALAALEKGAPA
ncbi:MAG: sigma 54-interacting transcriptional regulator [Candidatus Rokubacteria bacterium]|nr:sigma 54-interacting transcriptional regulator [Candidatus Rokubacteria bacterium]